MPIGPRVNEDNNSKKDGKDSKKKFISFKPKKPKYSFDDIILSNQIKEEVFDVLAYKEKSDFVFEQWGLNETHKHSKKVAINLYGKPGTGKTMTAHAIANYMEKDIIEVSYAEIESKYVGETPKNLTKVFEKAKKNDNILFFDEADAILSKRVTNMSHSTDTSVNQTRSVMLMLLNDYEGFIIFATNFIQNFDPAFMRRILAHIYFNMPDYNCRKKLWQHLIPDRLPHNLNIEYISKEYENISGSDISNAIFRAAFKAARREEKIVKQSYFEKAIKGIVKSKEKNKNSNYSNEKMKIKDRIVSEGYVKEQFREKESDEKSK